MPVVSSTPSCPEPLNDSLSLTIAPSPLVAPSSVATLNHPGPICLTPEAPVEVPAPRAEPSQAEPVTIEQTTIEHSVEPVVQPVVQAVVQPVKPIVVKTKAISRVVVTPLQPLAEPSKPNACSIVRSEVQSTALSTWAILLSFVGVLLIGVLGTTGDGVNVLMVGGVLCMSGIFFVHSLLAGKASTDDGDDLEAKRRKKKTPKRCKSRRSRSHAATDTLQGSTRNGSVQC